MFMHNGQVGGWQAVRRKVDALIPDSLYHYRQGTTDSEAILLVAMANGLQDDPVAAIADTLARVRGFQLAAGVTEALRFTAALTDGERLWAFRWASDSRPATLYWRQDAVGLTVVSEPIDDEGEGWNAVPKDCSIVVDADRRVQLGCLAEAVAAAA
jgi:glutamine amidotransferase